MAEYCIDCNKLDLRDTYCGKVRCNYRTEYIIPKTSSDYNCYGYCYSYSRSSSQKKDTESYISNYNTGCYITTILCNILGMKDNNYYLETLRKFRNYYMQINPNHLPLLVEYDIVGPIISKKILEDPSKEQLANKLFEQIIKKCVTLIENKQYDNAIKVYITMTEELKQAYNLNNIIISQNDIDISDPLQSGHGKRRILEKENRLQTK